MDELQVTSSDGNTATLCIRNLTIANESLGASQAESIELGVMKYGVFKTQLHLADVGRVADDAVVG